MVIAYQRKSNLIAARSLAVVGMQIGGSGLRQFVFAPFLSHPGARRPSPCLRQGPVRPRLQSDRPWASPDTGRRSSRVTAGAGEPPAAPGPSVGGKARLKAKGGEWAQEA